MWSAVAERSGDTALGGALPTRSKRNGTPVSRRAVFKSNVNDEVQTLPQIVLPHESRSSQATLRRSAMLCSAFFR